MSLTLDHVVIAVHDLDAAVADYTALGFNVLRGGDHPGRATHNALVVFADGSYFELIAWKSPSPEERWWQLLQRQGEGIVDFALLPPDTAQTVAGAARHGLVLDGPIDGGRVRPDGERLRWQTARPSSHDLPFLCGDLSPRALRVPEGDARVHPNGATGVASLAIAVHDIEATAARYRALLGSDADAADPVGPALALPGAVERFGLVRLGHTFLVLVSPRERADGPSAPSAPIAQRLSLRGEGPCALVLRSTTLGTNARPRRLDLGLTHGASIEFDSTPLLDTPSRTASSALES